MFLRHSTLAVALVITLSAAAATTQVFAADDEVDARAVPCSLERVRTDKAALTAPATVALPSSHAI